MNQINYSLKNIESIYFLIFYIIKNKGKWIVNLKNSESRINIEINGKKESLTL